MGKNALFLHKYKSIVNLEGKRQKKFREEKKEKITANIKKKKEHGGNSNSLTVQIASYSHWLSRVSIIPLM
jgi:hypothetical protein